MGGQPLRPGELCWQLIASANQDPRVFTDPYSFRLDRRNNPHLAFINGIHFCIGAPLARMEGQIVFKHLLERYTHILAGAEPAVRKTQAIISRGWRTRPVSLAEAK